MSWLDRIHEVQFEVSSRCNAACLGCSRYLNPGTINPYFDNNRDLSPHLIRDFLSQPELEELKSVLLNGNYGDPAAHPDLIEVARTITETRPDACLVMHTNGGLRTESFWRDLAKIMGGPNRWVKFSIDGLADTNSIYRRNVAWEKVMTNSRVFIEAGGRAAWKWVDFKHTRHQLEQARLLAKELGFRKFEVRRENTGVEDYSKPLPVRLSDHEATKRMSDEELDRLNETLVMARDLSTLDCQSKKGRSVFVDVNGKLWPCTWTANLPHSRWLEVREHFLRREIYAFESGFNDLRIHTVNEILEHTWFAKELEANWSSKKCLSTCALGCAKGLDHSLT